VIGRGRGCDRPSPEGAASPRADAAARAGVDWLVAPPSTDGEYFPVVYADRERALFVAVAGVLVLLTHGVDVVQAGGPNWPAFTARLAWCLLLLATAAVVRRGWLGPMRVMGVAACVGTVLLYLWLVLVTGRAGSHLLSFAYVLVMVLPLVMPELLAAALATSALLLVGAWAVLWRSGAGLAALLGWGHVGLVAIGIAWLLAHALRRARLAEAAQAQAALEAQVRLAESERQRAEGERLAALGRLANELAHDINNPLSAARSTATYLLARLPAGDADGREAGQDLVAALDRIAESVRQLKRGTRPPGAAPP
jgi:signal transduction histidine kinase